MQKLGSLQYFRKSLIGEPESMENMESQEAVVALGLDLGISFSRFNIFRNNKFELIPDEGGTF